jgi:hypothetical protein
MAGNMIGPHPAKAIRYLVILTTIASTVGCGGLGFGRKTAPAGFAPIGEPDMHPFSQPFPNLQSAREPINLPAPHRSPIALTDYRGEGDIIDLPIPGEATIAGNEGYIAGAPAVMGESCGPGGCAAPSCGPNGCSTDGLNLHGGPACAPMPPEYAGINKHHAYAAESQQYRAMTGKRKHHAWLTSWKKDPNPDIAYNNPRFPRELRMESHPQYIVEPPDVLYIEALTILPNRPLLGERLVRQDGTISLGYYGQVHVAGLTLLEIESKIRQHLKRYVENPQVYVDVASFNSKVYYVLGQVQQQGRLPVTGKETAHRSAQSRRRMRPDPLGRLEVAGFLRRHPNQLPSSSRRPNRRAGHGWLPDECRFGQLPLARRAIRFALRSDPIRTHSKLVTMG